MSTEIVPLISDEQMPFAKTGRDGTAEILLVRRAYVLIADCNSPSVRWDLSDLYVSLSFDISGQTTEASARRRAGLRRLKRLVADLTLDKHILGEVVRKKL